MTEVLGTDERRPPNVALRAVLVVALIVGGVVTAATRGSDRRPERPGPPLPTATATAPAPSPAEAADGAFARRYGPRVAGIGGVAVVMSHTAFEPVYGTLTTLDGPPGESPRTLSTQSGLAVAADGAGHDGWFAERLLPRDASVGALGSIDEVDLRAGGHVFSTVLPAAPSSVAVTPGAVWVGLSGAVAEVNPRTGALRTHAAPPGIVVDLVTDASRAVMFGAIAGPSGSRVVRWSLPGFTVLGERALADGYRVTHLALGPGGLWVSAADDAMHGRIDRLDPVTLGHEPLGSSAATGAARTVFAGTREVWLLGADGTLRCARPAAGGVQVGPPEHVPGFVRRADPTGLLAAVGERVYVVTATGTIAYERSVICPLP